MVIFDLKRLKLLLLMRQNHILLNPHLPAYINHVCSFTFAQYVCPTTDFFCTWPGTTLRCDS